MPERKEIHVLITFVVLFIAWVHKTLPAGSLVVEEVHSDPRQKEIAGIRQRENRLLKYAETLNEGMLQDKSHRDWALRLLRLALAIPDSHGLMIEAV